MHAKVLKLIELYNQVDRALEKDFPSDRYTPFSRRVNILADRRGLIGKYKDDLLLLADIRNILVHEFLDTQAPALEPSDSLIQHFEQICELITSPPKALTLAVPKERIFSVQEDTRVLKAISHMADKGYSHAPVLENGKIIGVFSESTVFTYLSQQGTISPDLRIGEIFDHLSLSKYKPERYRFAPADSDIFAIEDLFKHAIETGPRVAVVFLTSDGTRNGTLLGMITNLRAAFHR